MSEYLKWDKKKQYWLMKPPKNFRKSNEFMRCPKCGERKKKHTIHI